VGASHPKYRSVVSKRVHSLIGTGVPPINQGSEAAPPVIISFNAVIEVWVKDADALARRADEQRARRVPFCDPHRGFSLLTEEYRLYSQP
jgi:hypothetical protein